MLVSALLFFVNKIFQFSGKRAGILPPGEEKNNGGQGYGIVVFSRKEGTRQEAQFKVEAREIWMK